MKKRDVVILSKQIENRLKKRYDDPTLCNQYAWWMIESVTGKNQTELIAEKDITFTTKQIDTLEKYIQKQLEEKTPLQYLLGRVPFDNIKVLVEPPVLIPRPETEEMVYKIIDYFNKLEHKKITILDIGTGSGCIAISLAKILPETTIYATDISDEAIVLAKKNAAFNNTANITFLKSDIYESIPDNLKFDFIVSNPPYVSQEEWEQLDESVTKWEDKRALVAHKKGFAIIERIAAKAPEFLKINEEMESKKIPRLMIEIGYQQGEKTKEIFQNAGFVDVQVLKDMEGKDRFVVGRISNVAIQAIRT